MTMAASTTFDPQAGYLVTASPSFVNFSDETLATFYQPILGPAAFSLFYALKAQLIPQPTIAARRMQSGLLAQLNAGGQQVSQALHRLEAVGLVQTFFQHDDLGDVYVYQLQSTLTPEQFVDDNLLSILLLEEVGDQAFTQLVSRGRQFQLASENTQLKNVSHHFFDEFHVDSRSITATPPVIANLRKTAPVEKKPAIDEQVASDFDWPALNSLLANQPVVKEDLEAHRDLIQIEHQLYGIDEPTMKRLILRSVDLSNNHFDAKKFKRVVASTYNIVYSSTKDKDKVAEDNRDHGQEQPGNLTAQDRQLLASVAKWAPVEFLQVLKGQTGGYVTSGERYLLTRLVEEEKLPNDAINVLTWYVIADQGKSTLSANFVDAIANNWIRNKVTDAKGALVQLKSHNKQVKEPKQRQPRRRNNWRKTINEPMPEWSKKDSSELTKKASTQAVAKLKERIAKRKKKAN